MEGKVASRRNRVFKAKAIRTIVRMAFVLLCMTWIGLLGIESGI